MDCEYAPTAAERERKMRERDARERAHREAATPAEAVQFAARILNNTMASDWDSLDGATLHSLSTAAAYLAVAARKLAA